MSHTNVSMYMCCIINVSPVTFELALLAMCHIAAQPHVGYKIRTNVSSRIEINNENMVELLLVPPSPLDVRVCVGPARTRGSIYLDLKHLPPAAVFVVVTRNNRSWSGRFDHFELQRHVQLDSLVSTCFHSSTLQPQNSPRFTSLHPACALSVCGTFSLRAETF